MADRISLRFPDARLRRLIRGADDKLLRRVMPRALTRTAYEVRDAETKEAERVFDFAGPSTRKIMASPGAFRVTAAHPDRLVAAIRPAPINEQIILDHVRGATARAEEGERLAFGSSLAIPVTAKRGATGRVKKTERPSEVVKTRDEPVQEGDRRPRGFRIGDLIILRTGRGTRSKTRILYALTKTARIRPTFRFVGVAIRAAKATFNQKAIEEFRRARFGT